MDFHAAGEVEAELDGCFDRRGLVDADHRAAGSLLSKSKCAVWELGVGRGACDQAIFFGLR
jgi:hypothetical protein